MHRGFQSPKSSQGNESPVRGRRIGVVGLVRNPFLFTNNVGKGTGMSKRRLYSREEIEGVLKEAVKKRLIQNELDRQKRPKRPASKWPPNIAPRKDWKASNLKAKYGLTLKDYKNMVEDQDNTCEICKTEMDIPYVDHSHVTGETRGLLCYACNSGLGFFRDSIDILTAATDYLVLHRARDRDKT